MENLFLALFWQAEVLPARRGQAFPSAELDFLCKVFCRQIVNRVCLREIREAILTDKTLAAYVEKKYPKENKKIQNRRIRDILRLNAPKKDFLKKAKGYMNANQS